jgi:inositol transporter-like SP family MFS transporter
MALALAPLGMLGIRIVFLHLFVVAVVTWALRRGLSESARWKEAAKSAKGGLGNIADLFKGSTFKAILWTTTIYLFWNLAAGTAGIFNPYIISTLGVGGQAMSVGLSSANFILTMIVTITVFMKWSDHSHKARRTLWGIGAVLQVLGYGIFLVLPFTLWTVVANIVLFATSAALSGEAFYKVFSQELFPTNLRSTAQGFTFGMARLVLGIWSFFVPILAHTDIKNVAGLLTLFLAISGFVGFFFMPNTSGKSLEQIAEERA